jgi:sensor histidine kinase YesM
MKFLNTFIYGNWLVAISAGVLAACYSHAIQSDNELENGLLIGCGTLFMYNFQRLISPFPPLKPHPTQRFEWTVLNKRIVWFSGITGLAVAAILTFVGILNIFSVIVLIFAVFIGFAYATPLAGLKKPLREIPYLKIHLIALVWTLCCFVFPQINRQTSETFDPIWPFLAYFYFLGVTIPFDMRDVLNDYQTQKTIPQILGVKKAKSLAILVLLIFMVGVVYLVPTIRFNYIFVTAVFYQVVAIQLIKPGISSDIHYSGFIDGGIILLGLSFLLS